MAGDAQSVIRWMLHEGRLIPRTREFGAQMCERILAAGFPIARAFCGVDTLHPLIKGTAYVWRRDAPGAERLIASLAASQSDEFRLSPPRHAQVTGQQLRRRLEDPACPMDFAVLHDFSAAGGTDYLALPMRQSDGTNSVITFLSDRAGGFGDGDIAGLTEIAEVLAVIVELQSARSTARTLLDTYVGRRTGGRVLSGAIVRGAVEDIEAVILYADLRGFTELSEALPRDDVLALLNDWFEILTGAVTGEGGEVLKFIGDGLLAIFPAEAATTRERAAAALRAAQAAIAAIDRRNREREVAGAPVMRFAIALHLGEVAYGNIGAPDRLDFTVIGAAVNHANRLERLGAGLDHRLVTSAAFAAATGEGLASLGHHQLRGVREAQEVFGLESPA
ncbi:adenylate/guanylate cyclase domain-containing protein [Desertibaculum subflavum]|uniref:adenylate/guanylate cyclase domain-containing protein n=1 Tax=Desertibaculum subflavum TaxID=2268458 RepID=UPI000E669EC3